MSDGLPQNPLRTAGPLPIDPVVERLSRATNAVMWDCDLNTNTLRFSSNMASMLGYDETRLRSERDWWSERIHPEDRAQAVATLTEAVKSVKEQWTIEYRFLRGDCTYARIREQGFLITDDDGTPIRMVGVLDDLAHAENKEMSHQVLPHRPAEQALREYAEALERSNQELEEFAYVASHDLQEPLRMVASYTQLLAERYGGKLDADADEFIGYAVDGARRMQRLIDDLLLYSRVGSQGKEPSEVVVDEALDEAIANLAASIRESGAEIERGTMPTIQADRGQIVQLFQNLLSNAIKFRGSQPPRISIRAERRENEWMFSVCDNGIGIDPKYHDRIFVIFQRLHGRGEYAGTGIGLALCKRIVERHGGRIWVESSDDSGAAFRFALPVERKKGNEGSGRNFPGRRDTAR